MKDFVSIATFTYPHEFLMLKPILQKEKIQHFFQNEKIIEIIPFSSQAIGGIQLKVHRDHILRAKFILNEWENMEPLLKIV